MTRLRSVRAAFLIGATIAGGTPAAHGQVAPGAQAAPFLVAATWTDVAPTSVTFDENGNPFVLGKNNNQARFETTIPRGPVGQRRRGTLRAAYADGSYVVVPVRLVEDRPELSIAFLRAAALTCVTQVVERLERYSQDFQVTLNSYFEARELSLRAGACGTYAKKRVRKAWVDRSYNLATRNPQILFDEEAADALLKVAPEESSYVERLRTEANKIRFQLLTDQKLAAIDNRELAIADTLNDTLIAEVDVALKPPGSGNAIAGLSIKQLLRDRAFIASLSNAQ